MDVRIKFLGAVKSVTGSKYLLEIYEKRILVDWGLFQGQKELRLRNWSKLELSAKMRFDTHGEMASATALQTVIKAKGWNCTIPEHLDNV